MKNAIIMMAFLTMSSCALWPKPVSDEVESVCEKVCSVFFLLGCPAADGSPGEDEIYGNADDVICQIVCDNTLSAPGMAVDVDCIEAAQTCAAVDECWR